MKFVLMALIDDPNDYRVFVEDDPRIDIEQDYLLGYFDTKSELARILLDDNYWYREYPEYLEEDAESLWQEAMNMEVI